MTDAHEFDLAYANEQLRRSRHPLRRLLKSFYLRHALEDVEGPTIDFGCGAGQILARLPAGSIGVEINPVLVESLKESGLDVIAYDAAGDDFGFSGFAQGHYRTLVLSHVLEHFADAATVMRKMWRSAARLGIRTIIVIVPGGKGYASDATHKTFITGKYLAEQGLENCAGFKLEKLHYFPGNIAGLGKHFAFHELKVVFKREA